MNLDVPCMATASEWPPRETCLTKTPTQTPASVYRRQCSSNASAKSTAAAANPLCWNMLSKLLLSCSDSRLTLCWKLAQSQRFQRPLEAAAHLLRALFVSDHFSLPLRNLLSASCIVGPRLSRTSEKGHCTLQWGAVSLTCPLQAGRFVAGLLCCFYSSPALIAEGRNRRSEADVDDDATSTSTSNTLGSLSELGSEALSAGDPWEDCIELLFEKRYAPS